MKRTIGLLLPFILWLAACGSDADERPTPDRFTTPAPSASVTPAPQATIPPPPALITSTGPYTNAVGLLDGVCFEFLLSLDGQSWVWTSSADLAAFYDQVEASTLCPSPVTRRDFDFSQDILVGTVNVFTGCDAAHHITGLAQDDAAHTLTLLVEFEVRPGCAYELVQPLLVALPSPPAGYTVQLVVP